MSDPTLNFASQTDGQVTVDYENLTEGTVIVFVSEFGDEIDSGVTLAGSGSAGVPTEAAPPGRYRLCATVSGQQVAEPVQFYLAGAPDNS